jgi:sortase A
LVLAGLAGLIWSAALVADAVIAQRNARSTLQTAIPPQRPSPTPAFEETAVGTPREPAVHTGSAIAMLSIPRLQLSVAVLHGSDAQTLRRGPGHLENTAYPGEEGNVVIAGHRDSFFMPLRHVRVGDDVYLDTQRGRFHYQVESLRVVNARDLSVVAPTDGATLTLITCYPFWVLGNAPDRFVVRATPTGAPAAPPLEAHRLPPAVGDGLSTVSNATSNTVGSTSMGMATVTDDESLVRQAVGRYLFLQGAQLGTRPDARSSGNRTFTCDVTFDEDRATADCNPLAEASAADALHGRTFTLERSNGSWAIRAIVVK